MWIKKLKEAISEAFGEKCVCCFCGELIEKETPVTINLGLGGDSTQAMFAHGMCLQEKLHSSIPFIPPSDMED